MRISIFLLAFDVYKPGELCFTIVTYGGLPRGVGFSLAACAEECDEYVLFAFRSESGTCICFSLTDSDGGCDAQQNAGWSTYRIKNSAGDCVV